jgi:hypothetical protein
MLEHLIRAYLDHRAQLVTAYAELRRGAIELQEVEGLSRKLFDLEQGLEDNGIDERLFIALLTGRPQETRPEAPRLH